MSVLDEARAGRISPEVALARMLLAGMDPDGIEAALGAASQATLGDPVVAAMRQLLVARREPLRALAGEVRETLAGHDASGPDGIKRIANFFDRAVAHSPEASVALYSLGDPAILAAATAEVVGWLEAAGVLRPGADAVDLGCGIGRISAVLAGRCRSVLALDVSSGMVAEARRRLADRNNVRVERTGGGDLDQLPPEGIDLVLAVDSFPYVVQAGPAVVARHMTGAARALRPGGAFTILNLSYRGEDALDRADAAAWAASSGLALERCMERPFRLWDGSATVFRRVP